MSTDPEDHEAHSAARPAASMTTPPVKTPPVKTPPVTTPPVTTTVETIRLLEEVLRVAKREVETGRVRVTLRTETEQRDVHETLKSRRVVVERVAVGRQLPAGAAAPQSRTEDDVLIVPMVEEVLVVEKRLVVTEELRLRIVHESEAVSHTVPLRRQRAFVEELPPTADGAVR